VFPDMMARPGHVHFDQTMDNMPVASQVACVQREATHDGYGFKRVSVLMSFHRPIFHEGIDQDDGLYYSLHRK
jgi:hypothetical protein